METDKQKLERLIADEYQSIEKLKKKKKELDTYIDHCVSSISHYRLKLIELNNDQ